MKCIVRNECIVCGEKDLSGTMEIKDFPIYMGVYDGGDHLRHTMEYAMCTNCGCVQLKELIPLDILYKKNHNLEVIGPIWRKHNAEFLSFIGNASKILEIGDPSYKMVTASDGIFEFDTWHIVEPCPPNDFPEKVHYIEDVFDKDFNAETIPQVDTVILSHTFEHMYNPRDILNKINEVLLPGGTLYISIPNMEWISKNHMMPPGGMHFEHTYYASVENVKYLLNSCGLGINELYLYGNHSIFLKCKREKATLDTLDLEITNSHALLDIQFTYHKYRMKAMFINKKLQGVKGTTYLYGAHFPAQLLIALGLDTSNFAGVLDNAESKHGKKLYGTDLDVYPTNTVIIAKEPITVVCEMGPYTDEIKRSLTSMNERVQFCD